jgi:hypothetical protein
MQTHNKVDMIRRYQISIHTRPSSHAIPPGTANPPSTIAPHAYSNQRPKTRARRSSKNKQSKLYIEQGIWMSRVENKKATSRY